MGSFALLGEHYDEPLWGIGLIGQAFLAGVAVGLAQLVGPLSCRSRL